MADYNLTLAEAILRLEQSLAAMQRDPDRSQLTGVDPDLAFEAGFALCLDQLKLITGPDPKTDDALKKLRRVDPEAAKELEDRWATRR